MFTHSAFNARRQQRGITLIEVSIGLIIAAIIAAAAFIAFQNNQRRSEVRENVATITATLAEMQQKFGRTSNYLNLSTNIGLTSGTIEETNSYNGLIGLCSGVAGSLDCDSPAEDADVTTNVGILTWANVPQDQCLDLVSSTMQGAATVLVGEVEVANDGALEAVADCPDDANLITWVVNTRG